MRRKCSWTYLLFISSFHRPDSVEKFRLLTSTSYLTGLPRPEALRSRPLDIDLFKNNEMPNINHVSVASSPCHLLLFTLYQDQLVVQRGFGTLKWCWESTLQKHGGLFCVLQVGSWLQKGLMAPLSLGIMVYTDSPAQNEWQHCLERYSFPAIR